MFNEMWYAIVNFVQGMSAVAYYSILGVLAALTLLCLRAFLKENKKYEKFKAGKLVLIVFFFALALFLIFVRN